MKRTIQPITDFDDLRREILRTYLIFLPPKRADELKNRHFKEAYKAMKAVDTASEADSCDLISRSYEASARGYNSLYHEIYDEVKDIRDPDQVKDLFSKASSWGVSDVLTIIALIVFFIWMISY